MKQNKLLLLGVVLLLISNVLLSVSSIVNFRNEKDNEIQVLYFNDDAYEDRSVTLKKYYTNDGKELVIYGDTITDDVHYYLPGVTGDDRLTDPDGNLLKFSEYME